MVDNGGQWTHREWRVLRYLGVETKIIPNTTSFKALNVNGLVLSGGAPRIGTEALGLGNTNKYLDKANFPILGICVGCQFMAIHFGGKAGPAETPEYGKTKIFVDEENDLFKSLPKSFFVWESHNDEVKRLTEDFEILAHSKNCAVQAFKYLKKPFYGVQFHPEVEHTEYGYDIFKNFLKVCEEYMK